MLPFSTFIFQLEVTEWKYKPKSSFVKGDTSLRSLFTWSSEQNTCVFHQKSLLTLYYAAELIFMGNNNSNLWNWISTSDLNNLELSHHHQQKPLWGKGKFWNANWVDIIVNLQVFWNKNFPSENLGALYDARIVEFYFKKSWWNSCQFPKFKFIKCGLVGIFLIKELDHNEFCLRQTEYCSPCCFSAGVPRCLRDRLMKDS